MSAESVRFIPPPPSFSWGGALSTAFLSKQCFFFPALQGGLINFEKRRRVSVRSVPYPPPPTSPVPGTINP